MTNAEGKPFTKKVNAAIAKDNIFGKVYNFCFKSVWNTCLVADSVVKTTETIYENTFPCCKLCCL